MAAFYVYVHRRPDTGMPFYVGKGKNARARVKQHRNPYWCRVVEKAGQPVIEFPVSGVDEELSHLAEIELIDKIRRLGVRLTNMTDGGEGMAGYKIPQASVERRAALLRGVKRPDVSARLKGLPKTEEHKRNLSAACVGRKASDEARKKMSESRKGRPSTMLGKTHRPETIEKIASALRGEKNHFFGKSHTPETIAKIVAANKGKILSDETRRKMSIAVRPKPPPRTEDTIRRQRATLMARPLLTCPHCGKSANEGNAKRWHLDNCRSKM